MPSLTQDRNTPRRGTSFMVTDTIAREMTHRLWLEEGVYCGVSSGANVHFALEEVKKAKGRKLRAVALMCDHMNRYLTEERYVT